MEEIPIYEEIIRLKRTGGAGVLVTVVTNTGSTPRKAGAKMLVRADGTTTGTVGGGKVEAEMTARALEVLRTGRGGLESFALDETQGMVCGGKMTLYLEPLQTSPALLVVGKGHIGSALASLAETIGFRPFVLEPPQVEAPGALEELRRRLDELGGGAAAVVIATPSHLQDFLGARAALQTGASYIGIIGSRRKKKTLFDYLREHGVADKDLARLRIPVGLGIGAETPAEIAVSILAELIAWRRTDVQDIRHPPGRGKVPADGAEQTAASPG